MPPRLGAAEKRFSGLDFWTEMPKFHLSYTLSINVLGRPPCTDAAATLCVASLLWRATSSQAHLLVAEMQPLALPKGQGWAEIQEPGPRQLGRGCRLSWVAQQGGREPGRATSVCAACWFPIHRPGEKPQESPLMQGQTAEPRGWERPPTILERQSPSNPSSTRCPEEMVMLTHPCCPLQHCGKADPTGELSFGSRSSPPACCAWHATSCGPGMAQGAPPGRGVT